MAIARLRFCLAFSILETWELPAVTVAGTLVNNAHLVQPGSTLASMAASDSAGDDNIFELLKQADPSELEQRQRAINERIHATFQLSQQRLAELIDQNSTLPTTVSSVTVLGAPNTRHGFLKGVVNPLLSANRDRPYTQSELIHEVAKTADKLKRFGMNILKQDVCSRLICFCRNLPGLLCLHRQTSQN